MAHHEKGSPEELIRRGREPQRRRQRPWWSGFAAVIALLLAAASSVAVVRQGGRLTTSGSQPAPGVSSEGDTEAHVGVGAPLAMQTLVPVGGVDLSAAALAVNPATGRVYVAMRCMSDGHVCLPTSDALRVIDGVSGRTIDSIRVGPGVSAVAVDTLRDRVYVASEGTKASSATVAVIDGRTDQIIARIATSVGVSGLAVDPRQDLVFGAAAGSGDLLTIDPAARRVVRHTPIAGPNGAIAVSSTSGLVYAATAPTARSQHAATAFGSLAVVDGATGRLVARVEMPPLPAAIAVDETVDRVFVAAESNIVVALDGPTATVLRRIAIDRPVYGLAVDGGTLVAVGGRDDTLTRVTLLDPDTFVARASVAFPGGAAVAIDPRAQRIYAIRTDVLAIMTFGGDSG